MHPGLEVKGLNVSAIRGGGDYMSGINPLTAGAADIRVFIFY